MKVFRNSPPKQAKKKWVRQLSRIKDYVIKDNIRVIAAGVAFYFFLALFPAMVAVMSAYGFLTESPQIYEHGKQLTEVFPEEVHNLMTHRLGVIAEESRSMLGWEVVFSILISFWIANLGTKTLFDGINIVYKHSHQRSFVRQNAIIMLFTFLGIIVSAIAIAVVVGFPAISEYLGLPEPWGNLLQWSRWVVLAAITVVCLAFVYKYAPAKHTPLFKNVIRGAVVAISLWLLGSLAFTFYVKNVDIFEQNYGSEASVVVMMLWFYMTSFAILLGAEVNSELEQERFHSMKVEGPEEVRYYGGRRAA